MDAAGDDAWVDAQGGSHHWAIRTTMAATDAPVSILQILAPLRDPATGLPQYFFASLGERSGSHALPTTYEVADRNFAPVAVPAVAAMVGSDGFVGVDPAQSGLAYLAIANQLRALRWSAGGVSVDGTSAHTFGGAAAVTGVADARSLYFNDGASVLAVADGAVSAIGSLSANPASLTDAGGHLAALEITGATSNQAIYQLETLPKSGGAPTLVEGASTTLQLLAAGDQGLVLAGTPEQGQAFVLASADNRVRTTIGAQYVGVVRAASGRADQPPAPVALLSCVAGSTGFCASGALTQTTLTGAAATLGTLAANASWVRGDAVAGVATSLAGQTLLSSPAGFGDGQTDARDAWQFMPGTTSSLTRITSSLP
jgi:hypothetical protein